MKSIIFFALLFLSLLSPLTLAADPAPAVSPDLFGDPAQTPAPAATPALAPAKAHVRRKVTANSAHSRVKSRPVAATPAPTPAVTPEPTPAAAAQPAMPASPSGEEAGAVSDPPNAAQPQPQPQREVAGGATGEALGGGTPVTPVQPSDAVAAQKPKNPTIQVSLERIRLIRTKTFKKHGSAGESETEEQTTEQMAGGADAEQWFSSLTMQFRLEPPADWDLISVDDAKIIQAADQAGRPLLAPTTPDGSNHTAKAASLSPLAPMIRKAGRGMVVLVRMDPPPVGTTKFNPLNVRFNVTLGYRKMLKVSDIRKKVSKSFLHNTQISDIAMELTEVGADVVSLGASGNFSRIGDVHFADNQGQALVPDTTEILTPEPDKPNGIPLKQWNYSFAKLPEKVDMMVEMFPETRQQAVAVTVIASLP